jgi:hypothetical protein
LRALDQKATSDDRCVAGRCSEASVTANENAKTAADVSTVAFIGAAVFAAAGIYLLVTAPNEAR